MDYELTGWLVGCYVLGVLLYIVELRAGRLTFTPKWTAVPATILWPLTTFAIGIAAFMQWRRS